MNITKENIDALNAVVKIDIASADYKEKVEKILSDYRKNANIPGFRKGHVPMGMIRKQYEKAVIVDEVNKLLQENLNKFLVDEKIDILGNPLPKVNENFSWEDENYSFEFELGLAPEFEVDVKGKNKIVEYKIEATDELLTEEVNNIQKRYGKLINLDEVSDEANVTGTFINEENDINKDATLYIKDLKGKKNEKKIVGKKVGDVVELNTKGLFEEDFKLAQLIGKSLPEVKDLDITLTFTINEITKTELADLDEELFGKLAPDGSIKTATDLKEKIKEDAEKQFQQQADQQLLNAITEHFIENTKFDLPEEFLKRWLQTAGEKELTAEEATAEYEKSEKGLRYQLIEGKVMKDNDIKLDYAELIDYTKGFIKAQMAQFGNTNPADEEVTEIAQRVLSNQDEAQRLQQQLITTKLLTFYKENMKFKTKKVDYEQFIKEVYS